MKYMSFFCDPCEIITVDLINRIAKQRQECELFGIGVYSDELFEKKFERRPIRPYLERAQVTESIKGVDFVFKVDDEEEKEIFEIEKKTQIQFFNTSEKKYKIGYAPGTYDLFHQGHLEHLLEAHSKCEILIVGINNDELVHSYKNKYPIMPADVREKIIKNLKFVSGTYIADALERGKANEWIKKTYGSGIDVVFIGSDWEDKDLHNPEGFKIIFTERDSEKMKTRSSSFYREQLSHIENFQI